MWRRSEALVRGLEAKGTRMYSVKGICINREISPLNEKNTKTRILLSLFRLFLLSCVFSYLRFRRSFTCPFIGFWCYSEWPMNVKLGLPKQEVRPTFHTLRVQVILGHALLRRDEKRKAQRNEKVTKKKIQVFFTYPKEEEGAFLCK